MNGLLQISDPHFGTERPAAVEALVRLVAQRRPALVVLSGDITQRATVAEFAAAKRFVERLGPVPLLVVPGNHDIPLFNVLGRLTRPYAHYEAVFGPAVDTEYVDGRWHVVALKTTRRWRHKNGEVSARQIAFAAQRLRAASSPAQLKVVVTHQPVAVTQASDRANLLRGAAAAVRAWRAAGVDLVLGGHIHLPFVQPLHATEDAQRLWAVQAGTAVSSRVRGSVQNSVTELLWTPPGDCDGDGDGDRARACHVRFWEWPGTGQEFVPREDIALPLASAAAAGI